MEEKVVVVVVVVVVAAAAAAVVVLGVFENWAGTCVFDFDLNRPTIILVVATDIVGYSGSPRTSFTTFKHITR